MNNSLYFHSVFSVNQYISKNVLLTLRGVLFALVLSFLPSLSQADAAGGYPEKPVRLIVPFASGGPTDLTARIIGEALGRQWGQPVVIENRPGAGGTIGAAAAAKAAPDGYTLFLGGSATHAIAGSLYKNLSYDPQKDFEPISAAVFYADAVLAHPSVPANNLQDLIKLTKTDPDYKVYGSDGNGSASHLAMELIKERGKFQMDVVQYKGAAPLLNDIAGNFVKVGVTGLPAADPFIKAGKIKLIAVTTDRDYTGQNYPTAEDQGFPGFQATAWSGIFAPKDTPKAIIDKISRDMVAGINSEETTEKLKHQGLQPFPGSPEQLARFLDEEIKQWAVAVKISGAQVE